MNRLFAWVVVVFSLFPQIASASAIESARFELGDEEFALHLSATGELGDPLVRTEAGHIRVWFPHVDGNVRLDPEPDGAAIRSIRIRPGFSDTSVILFRVGREHTVPVSAVRVERSGDRGTIFIRRDAIPLPAGPPDAAALAVDPVEQDADEALLAEPPPAALAPEGGNPIDALADEPSDEATPPEPEVDEAPAAPRPIVLADSSPDLGVLLLVSLLLGAAYCGVKLVTRNRKKRILEDIQIVSSKRLGTRHQIVLVRALGEDHLLSINGTQTHCISSTPTILDDEGDGEESTRDSADGVLARIQDRFYFRPRIAENDIAPAPAPIRRQSKRSEPKRFGAELLRFAIDSEKSPPMVPARPRGRRRGESEAVAGLVKLRERLAQSA